MVPLKRGGAPWDEDTRYGMLGKNVRASPNHTKPRRRPTPEAYGREAELDEHDSRRMMGRNIGEVRVDSGGT